MIHLNFVTVKYNKNIGATILRLTVVLGCKLISSGIRLIKIKFNHFVVERVCLVVNSTLVRGVTEGLIPSGSEIQSLRG